MLSREETIEKLKKARDLRGLPPFPDKFYVTYGRQLETEKCAGCGKRKNVGEEEKTRRLKICKKCEHYDGHYEDKIRCEAKQCKTCPNGYVKLTSSCEKWVEKL